MKRDSTKVMTCVGIGIFFLVFQLNLTRVPRTNVSTHSVKSQDTKSSVPKSTGLVADTESWVPKSTGHRKTDPPPPTTEKDITCDRSHNSYDLCAIKGPTVLDPTTATFFVVYPTSLTPEKPPMEERVRPYPRKHENFTMSRIREVTLVSGPPTPKCDVQHHAPAIVFSAAGYTGNVWHDFNDGLIPLYVTINTIFPDQDVVLVISKARDWWVNKYRALLHSFSKHPIINLDNDTATHCFPSMAAGMISHGFMTIDPKLMRNSETFTHFRSFLDKAFGQNHEGPNENDNKPLVYKTREPRRPLLVLASRSGGIGRVLLNQNELKLEAEKIGFNVISFEPTTKTPLRDAYALINSSHAMVGMHGAALTHLLFLRPGSVFMQVVPLGAEWVADVCYERPARAIGIEYIEYRITPEESSLIEKYSKDEMILKDPVAYRSGKTWSHEIMTTYLKEQNVKLDMVRVREYLKEAYAKAKKLMDSEG